MRNTIKYVPYGIGGTNATVADIERLVRQGAKDGEYIELARSILAVSRVPERDHMAEVHAIHRWVQNNTRYTSDSTEAEVLTSPKAMMNFYRKTGMFIGDCDEFVTLEGILLRSIGFMTRHTVISQAMQDPMNRMGHIYHEVLVSGQWIPIDPIMKSKPVGYRPPMYTAIKTYTNGIGGVGMSWSREEVAAQKEQHKRRLSHLNSERLRMRLAKREAILTREEDQMKDTGGTAIIRINGIQRSSVGLMGQQYEAYPYGLAGRRSAAVRAPKAQQRPRVAKARPVKKGRGPKPVGYHKFKFGLGADPSDPKELYAKYAEKATRYKQRIPLINSAGARQQLQAAFGPIYSQMGSLANSFATSGATAGANDIKKLADWVNAVNAFSRALLAAEKQFGTGAAVTASAPSEVSFTGPRQPVKTTDAAGFMSNIPKPVLFGGLALGVFLLMRK